MRQLLPVVALAALLVPVTAHADVFGVAFTSGVNSGVLILTTTNTQTSGYYTVTSLTGEEDGRTVTLLAPNTYGVNDNSFSTTSPFLDDNGIGFSVAGLGDSNLYYDGPNATDIDRLCTGTEYCLGISPGAAATVTLVPTPEPSSLILLGTGILSAAGATRRRFRKA